MSDAASPTPTRTALDDNAFRRLGVSPRDDRRRIVEAAESQALHDDPEACRQARADLTNPRARLAVELAWLPGLPPRAAETLVAELQRDPIATAMRKGLPDLARANLMSAAFERLDAASLDAGTAADFMRLFGESVDRLAPEAVLREINEDRAVAGFPEVRDAALVAEELERRRKHYRGVLKTALDGMAPDTLVRTMTLLVERSTKSGSQSAPALVDELVDTYAVETQVFLDREEQSAKAVMGRLREQAAAGLSTAALLDTLEQVLRNWSRVAKPVQISTMARGMAHPASQSLAHGVRGLAVSLFNDHDHLEQSDRLNALLRELFAEVGDVAERADEDAKVLADIARRRELAKLVEPLRERCRACAARADSAPAAVDRDLDALLAQAPALLAPLEAESDAPADLIVMARDEVAQCVVYCTVAYVNESRNWKRAQALLEQAETWALDPKTIQRLAENRRVVDRNVKLLGDLEPIKSAPTLYTMNGIGFTLYGKTDADAESKSHMATYYFVFLFIPLIPICRYRVVAHGNGSYNFLGRGGLRTFDKIHLAFTAALVLLPLASSFYK